MEDKLTYAQLRALAVDPGQIGAYSGSPLGSEVGVHVHSYEPYNVHVVVNGVKIAEVHPGRTEVLSPGDPFLSRLPDPQVRYF